MMVKHPAFIDEIPTYVPGTAPAPTSTARPIKLSSNESPWPPLPSVHEAIVASVTGVNRYPDFHRSAVRDAIGARFGVAPDWVTVDNGSGSLINGIIRVTSTVGDEIVYPWPSFEGYPIAVLLSGATRRPIPLDPSFDHDLDAMLAAINDDTRVVMICNPNNPTGSFIPFADLEAFVQRVPSDVVVIIDEAYREFVTTESPDQTLGLVSTNANVVILRTFSKAYGLAGLRVGYAIAQPSLITLIDKSIEGFSVSAPAQAAAVASLTPTAQTELADRVSRLVAERESMQRALAELGIEHVPSHASFILIPMDDPEPIAAALQQDAIAVRPLRAGLRITIGTAEENARCLAALEQALSPSTAP